MVRVRAGLMAKEYFVFDLEKVSGESGAFKTGLTKTLYYTWMSPKEETKNTADFPIEQPPAANRNTLRE